MFLKSPAEKSGLDKAIDHVQLAMHDVRPHTDAYVVMVDQLDKLYKLKEIDKPERVSKDTLAIVAGNLVGIVLIVGYERANIVTSKALTFLRTTR